MSMYISEGHPEQGAASPHLHIYCQTLEEVLCYSKTQIYSSMLQVHYICEGNIGLLFDITIYFDFTSKTSDQGMEYKTSSYSIKCYT